MGDRAGTGVQNLGGTTWRVKKKVLVRVELPLAYFPHDHTYHFQKKTKKKKNLSFSNVSE